jgi:hypothetical protein
VRIASSTSTTVVMSDQGQATMEDIYNLLSTTSIRSENVSIWLDSAINVLITHGHDTM